MTKRILVTGAGGFVGTYLIKELQKDPANEIFGSVYKATSDISALLPADHVLQGDLTVGQVAQTHLETAKPDLIYHLAALSVVHSSVANALPTIQGNTAISYNLFEAIKAVVPRARTLAVCSANVYGAVAPVDLPTRETAPFNPLNPYAVSKIAQEMLALQAHLAHGLDVVIVRPFNHSGPGQTGDFVLPKLAQQVVRIERELSLPVLELGSGDSVRDFTDVRDMVKAYVLAAAQGLAGEVYNLGSGVGHTIRQIAEIYLSLSQKKFTIQELPSLSRPSDVPALVADVTKFRTLTAFLPTISLERTISDILEYERKNYHD